MDTNVRNLSDGELVAPKGLPPVAQLDRLADQHRELTAKMVAHLAEVERRKLHLKLGYSSLYTYATQRLRLTEHEAYLRPAERDFLRSNHGGPRGAAQ